MTARSLLALTFLALAPIPVRAQITTFVPPAPHSDSVRAAVVAEQRAAADSATTKTLANMKSWVDSAAGVTSPADSVTTQVATTSTTTTTATTEPATPRVTTTFSNGAVAPETASPLPLIALVGLAALSLGTVMLAGRDRV